MKIIVSKFVKLKLTSNYFWAIRNYTKLLSSTQTVMSTAFPHFCKNLTVCVTLILVGPLERKLKALHQQNKRQITNLPHSGDMKQHCFE